jgi:FtsH-binding integral membrane protein
MATGMFALYAALNGLTLSFIFAAYEIALIQNVFFVTAGMFAGLALWGTFTKNDLTSVGSICGMALWGIIIASIVNMFFGSSGFDLIISFAGVLVFTGLTMYDAQKIRQIAEHENMMDRESLIKIGVVGALSLYLDFINLFLYLLRLFSRER